MVDGRLANALRMAWEVWWAHVLGFALSGSGCMPRTQWGPRRVVENVVVGPIMAALAFIYADLVIVPIVNAYRKYDGARFAALLVAVMFGAMAVAALVVDGLKRLIRSR